MSGTARTTPSDHELCPEVVAAATQLENMRQTQERHGREIFGSGDTGSGLAKHVEGMGVKVDSLIVWQRLIMAAVVSQVAVTLFGSPRLSLPSARAADLPALSVPVDPLLVSPLPEPSGAFRRR